MEIFNQRNNLGDIKFSKKTLPEPVPSGAQPEQSTLLPWLQHIDEVC